MFCRMMPGYEEIFCFPVDGVLAVHCVPVIGSGFREITPASSHWHMEAGVYGREVTRRPSGRILTWALMRAAILYTLRTGTCASH